MRTSRKEWHVQDKEVGGHRGHREKASMHPGYILKGAKIKREREPGFLESLAVQKCVGPVLSAVRAAGGFTKGNVLGMTTSVDE